MYGLKSLEVCWVKVSYDKDLLYTYVLCLQLIIIINDLFVDYFHDY